MQFIEYLEAISRVADRVIAGGQGNNASYYQDPDETSKIIVEGLPMNKDTSIL